MRTLWLIAGLTACTSSHGGGSTLATLQKNCPEAAYWNGSACVPDHRPSPSLKKGAEALAEFDVDAAMPLLDAALGEGPYDNEQLITLHEQRGIAFSYLQREQEALAEFARLLSLDRGHLLSYTLSPKATFLFERARKLNDAEGTAELTLSWPKELLVSDKVPINVEVVADPHSMLRKLALFVRKQGESQYHRLALELPPVGAYERLHLPATRGSEAAVLEIYAKAYDEGGNEVLLWNEATRPREITLGYQAPTPWYKNPWILSGMLGAVAVGAGTAVYFLTLEPPDTIGGGFTVNN